MAVQGRIQPDRKGPVFSNVIQRTSFFLSQIRAHKTRIFKKIPAPVPLTISSGNPGHYQSLIFKNILKNPVSDKLVTLIL